MTLYVARQHFARAFSVCTRGEDGEGRNHSSHLKCIPRPRTCRKSGGERQNRQLRREDCDEGVATSVSAKRRPVARGARRKVGLAVRLRECGAEAGRAYWRSRSIAEVK